MRAYGKVDTCFWTDAKIRSLSEKGKLFFLYLLTCPHSSPVGCYRLPIAYIASDLKWVDETVRETVRETLSKGLIEYDFDHEIVLLNNHFKHNTIDNPNVAKNCIQYIDAIDKKIPIYHKLLKLLQPFAERFPKGYINRLPNGIGNMEPSLAKPEPSLITTQESAPDDFQKIFDAGCAVNPALVTKSTAVIHQWLAEGITSQDAVPEIQRLADKARSWTFFTGAILDAKATRETPLPKGKNHAAAIGNQRENFTSEGERLAAKYRADAEREEQSAIGGNIEPGLCIAEAIR